MYELKNKKLTPIKIGCIENFPFLDNDFDKITDWEIMQLLGQKINEITYVINNILDEKIDAYIQEKFNDIMIGATYESESETLILAYEEVNNE